MGLAQEVKDLRSAMRDNYPNWDEKECSVLNIKTIPLHCRPNISMAELDKLKKQCGIYLGQLIDIDEALRIALKDNITGMYRERIEYLESIPL